MSGDERKEVEQIAGNRHWTQPVGVDKDGAVVNLYGIGVCPSTVFAYARRQGAHDQARQPHRGPAARAGARHPEAAAAAEGHDCALTMADPALERGLGRRRAGGGVPRPRAW